MDLKQGPIFRLFDRGGQGLACDVDGVALGGVTLAAVATDAQGRRSCRVRPAWEIECIVSLAYGPQSDAVVQRLGRGLRRVAARLEASDLAGAGVEAVMLRIPEIDADGLRKLSAFEALEKGGGSWWEDEPRVPAGSRDGGQWTTGRGAAPSAPADASSGSPEGSSRERTVVSSVRQFRTPNANGFFPNTAGGGVFYIPTLSDGRSVRPTEVHVLDANAYRVTWTDDTITLTGRTGRVIRVSVSDLAHFNAATGQIRGVQIYAFPREPLADLDALTPAEQRDLAQDRAHLTVAEQAWENSPDGRAIGAAVTGEAALPLVALIPEFSSAVPRLTLNTLEANEAAIFRARRLGLEAERAVGIIGPKVGIRVAGRLRIPDELDKVARTLTEVKNVARLRFTPQLRDFLAYCRTYGYRLILHIRTGTELSPELEEMIASGEIKRANIPGT